MSQAVKRIAEVPAGEPKPARFLFDLDLSGNRSARRLTAEDLAAARAEGVTAGIAEGRASAEARAAERLASETARLADAAERLLSIADAELERMRADAAALAVATGRSLAEALIGRQPAAEIEALVESCLGPLRETPHLVLRLRAADAGVMRERLAAAAERHGFAGRLVVLGEDDFAPGDCRIEWADGGIVRDRAKALAAIEAAISRRFPAGNPEDHP